MNEYVNRLMENYRNNIDNRRLFFPIVMMILFILLAIESFGEDESLKIKNKQTAFGIIEKVVNIGRENDQPYNSYRRQYFFDNKYIANITIKYEVKGRKYYTEKQVKSYRSFNSINSEYAVGKKIKIVYNVENPNQSAVNKFEIYEFAIWIIAILPILILIDIIHEKYKNKGSNILLKLIKIDYIDYARERVFFEDENNNLYYYETDFGEELQINEQYEIKLRNKNKKIRKIEYEDKFVKAIQIVNIERKEFVKKI